MPPKENIAPQFSPDIIAENKNGLQWCINQLDNPGNFYEIDADFLGFLIDQDDEEGNFMCGEGAGPGIIPLLRFNKKHNPEAFNYPEIERKLEKFIARQIESELAKQASVAAIIDRATSVEAVEAEQPNVTFDPETLNWLVESFLPIIKTKMPGATELQIKIKSFEERAKELKKNLAKVPPEKIERYKIVVLRNQLKQKKLPALTKIEAESFDIKFIQTIFQKVGLFESVQKSLASQNDFFNLLENSRDERDIRIVKNWKNGKQINFAIDGEYGDAFYLAVKYLQYLHFDDDPKQIDGILGSGTAQLLVDAYKEFEKENAAR